MHPKIYKVQYQFEFPKLTVDFV